MSSQRSWPAQHLLRFLCVLGMVTVHAFYWIGTAGRRFLLEPSAPYYELARWSMVVGILPLLLPFTAGCALRLALPARLKSASLRRLLTQSVALATLGLLMNVLASGWHALWAWNVLQFVGLSFAVMGVLLLFRSFGPALAAGLLVLVAADPVRLWLPPAGRPEWSRVLLGDPTDFHTWPFVPWFATVVFGWLIAHLYLRSGGGRRFSWGIGVAGAAMMAGASLFVGVVPPFDADNLIGPQVMELPALSVVGLMGAAALLTALLTAASSGRSFRTYGIVRCYSHGILWIYVVHVILGARLSRLLFRHVDQWTLVNDPGAPSHLALILGFPLFLLLSSWLVGFLSIRWLKEKAIRIRIRRARTAET